ncbi:MAG TPA: glycosyltransferase family 4 protein [Solirubrobacteraceae bacterium]|jgi:colanic acid biosynthesis glycosyl transferase WcaI|nr:glycosyltransferase family 4 protein [Solirubrobacteraceae bacterium]
MRILIINKYYPPDTASTAQLLGELVEDLAVTGRVDLVVGRPSYDPGALRPDPAGVTVRRVPSSSLGRGSVVKRLFDYISFLALGLGAACVAQRPDVVVSMSDPPLVGLIGALAAARHRCCFVQICHDVHPDIAIALGKAREGILTRIWRSANRYVQRRANRIVVVGRDMEEKLAAEGVARERLRFIPTWASEQENSPQVLTAVRSRCGWLEKFVVMHAGNMGLSQNMEMYPQVAMALQDLTDLVIVFVGDGPAKEGLVKEASAQGLGNLQFVPRLPKSEAQRLMAAADIHLVSLVPGLWGCAAPSKTYGIMAAGRPFIASVDAGSEPARIVGEFGCGFVVAAGSSSELAQTIRAARHATLAEMGRGARRGFETRYRRATATSAIGVVLREAVEERDLKDRRLEGCRKPRRT